MRNRLNTLPLLSGVLLLSLGALAAAQDNPDLDAQSGRDKVLPMVRTNTPPIIDGVMDEIWNTAAIVDDLHQVQPIEFAAPSEKTIIRVLFDEDFLYVSGMMYYSDTSQIIGNKLMQGANMREEDKLRVYINPLMMVETDTSSKPTLMVYEQKPCSRT